MKRKLTIVAAIALFTSSAWAGLYEPAPFELDLEIRQAFGDMTSVANSNSDAEFIGCGTRSFDVGGGTFRLGFCQAQDADGTFVQCFTESPALLGEIDSLSDRAFITFSWDEDGNCTAVGNSTQSFYLTKIKPATPNKGKDDEE